MLLMNSLGNTGLLLFDLLVPTTFDNLHTTAGVLKLFVIDSLLVSRENGQILRRKNLKMNHPFCFFTCLFFCPPPPAIATDLVWPCAH